MSRGPSRVIVPLYGEEGKAYLVIAMEGYLPEPKIQAHVTHRDIEPRRMDQ